MNRLRILGTALAVSGLTLVGLATTAPANADQPGEKTVTWTVTSGDFANRFGTPQTLFTGDVAACGVGPFQQDTYRYDTAEHRATVDALIAKGTLTGSSEDQSVWISNVDLPATATCESATPTPSTTPSATPTPSPSPTESTPTTPSATPSPSTPGAHPSPSSPTSTTAPSRPHAGGTGNDSGPTHLTTATAPEADQLAFTGARDAGLSIGTGAAFITAGLLLVAIARRKGKNA